MNMNILRLQDVYLDKIISIIFVHVSICFIFFNRGSELMIDRKDFFRNTVDTVK